MFWTQSDIQWPIIVFNPTLYIFFSIENCDETEEIFSFQRYLSPVFEEIEYDSDSDSQTSHSTSKYDYDSGSTGKFWATPAEAVLEPESPLISEIDLEIPSPEGKSLCLKGHKRFKL